jgi:hypothetical protein
VGRGRREAPPGYLLPLLAPVFRRQMRASLERINELLSHPD